MPFKLDAESLARIVGETLEEATFVFSEPVESAPDWDEEVLEARIAFTGPDQGELRMAVTSSFALELAINLLGVEAEEPGIEDKGKDALAEILNITTGALMVEIFGRDSLCKLEPPKVVQVSQADHAGQHRGASSAVSLVTEEEQRIDVALYLPSDS